MLPITTLSTAENVAYFTPELAQTFERLAALNEISQRELAELRASTEALRESTKRMGEQLGGIANNQGAVTEEFFYNSLLEHPEIGPFTFSKITPHVLVGSKGKETEFDLVLVNGNSVVVVEVKYRLHPSHVERLAGQIEAFKALSPEFRGHAVYGALAGFSVPKAVRDLALAQGYMVLQRKGQRIHSFTEGLRTR